MNTEGQFVDRPLVADIIRKASILSGISIEDIRGPSRERYLVEIRSAIVWVARQYCTRPSARDRFSYTLIAKALNRLDHTTIINMHQKFQSYAKRNPKFRAFADSLKEAMGNPFDNVDYQLDQFRKKLDDIESERVEKKKLAAQARKMLAHQQKMTKRDENMLRRQLEALKAKQRLEQDRNDDISECHSMPKNNFMPNALDDVDGGHIAMASIALGSRKLLKAILKEGRHDFYIPSKTTIKQKIIIG